MPAHAPRTATVKRSHRIFRVDDAAVVIGVGPDELMLEAARVCPTVAIRVTDRATGEQIFP